MSLGGAPGPKAAGLSGVGGAGPPGPPAAGMGGGTQPGGLVTAARHIPSCVGKGGANGRKAPNGWLNGVGAGGPGNGGPAGTTAGAAGPGGAPPTGAAGAVGSSSPELLDSLAGGR